MQNRNISTPTSIFSLILIRSSTACFNSSDLFVVTNMGQKVSPLSYICHFCVIVAEMHVQEKWIVLNLKVIDELYAERDDDHDHRIQEQRILYDSESVFRRLLGYSPQMSTCPNDQSDHGQADYDCSYDEAPEHGFSYCHEI